jgi:hypothetical protein
MGRRDDGMVEVGVKAKNRGFGRWLREERMSERARSLCG